MLGCSASKSAMILGAISCTVGVLYWFHHEMVTCPSAAAAPPASPAPLWPAGAAGAQAARATAPAAIPVHCRNWRRLSMLTFAFTDIWVLLLTPLNWVQSKSDVLAV